MSTETKEHVHDCTGPDMKCPCGYVPRFPPISFSLEISHRLRIVVNEGFSCDSLDTVAATLHNIADKIDRGELR